MRRFFFVFYLLLFLFNATRAESYECPVNYCKNYEENDECPKLEKTDEDHKLEMLAPTPCNCCDYYLIKLDEDEQCLIGTPSSPRPYSICGDGLYCKESAVKGEGRCVQITTKCTEKQAEWDKKRAEGTLGNMEPRPKCDRNGDFYRIWCIPGQTCYCQNKEGVRIFGTMEYSPSVDRDFFCECSRKVDIANRLIKKTLKFDNRVMRCLPNGNYDPLQCTDNSTCLCVDDKTGVPSENDWFKKPVAVADISNDTLWCFDKKIHTEGEFVKLCQKKYEQIRSETLSLENEGVTVLKENLPKCDVDGSYYQVQESLTQQFCADPFGGQLKTYIVDKSSSLAKNMDCNCARAEYLLEDNTAAYKPQCCDNGNYYQLQCRYDECYCVDGNGNQIEKEVHRSKIQTLPCYSTTKKCTSVEI